MSFQEAERIFGTPKLIKMDIEGGEKDFFDSQDYKEWLIAHSIVWLVEIHFDKLKFTPEWHDVPHDEIRPGYFIYCNNPSELERIKIKCCHRKKPCA